MRILFIGNSRIGDFILSSGLLAHLIETRDALDVLIRANSGSGNNHAAGWAA